MSSMVITAYYFSKADNKTTLTFNKYFTQQLTDSNDVEKL